MIVAHGGAVGTAIRLLLGSDAFTVNVGNTTLHSLTWMVPAGTSNTSITGSTWQVCEAIGGKRYGSIMLGADLRP